MTSEERKKFKYLKRKEKMQGILSDDELVELATLYMKNTNRNLDIALIISGIAAFMSIALLIITIIYKLGR